MKAKFLLFALVVFVGGEDISAQITGSDTVCAGYIYTYKVNMPGAVSFNWTLPNGWYFLNGQGTDSVKVNCNVDTGNVCVIGFDTAANAVDTFCKPVYWGGGGSSWHVNGSPGQCDCRYTLSIVNTGSCGASGCGNGYPNPNIIYGVYDNTWPIGKYLGYVDYGFNYFNSSVGRVYVYIIDTTYGTQKLVDGGVSGCSVVNYFDMPGPQTPVVLDQRPNPVCLGDTFTIFVDPFSNYTSFCWQFFNIHWYPSSNLNVIWSGNDSAICIYTGYPLNAGITFVASTVACSFQGNTSLYAKICSPVGIDEIATLKKISIYPNPIHNKLTVTFTSSKNEHCFIQFCDVMGRVALEKTFWSTGSENKFEVDVAGLAKGVYVLSVGGERVKVVVE